LLHDCSPYFGHKNKPHVVQLSLPHFFSTHKRVQMSLSGFEKQVLNNRIDDMLELIVAYRKLVERFIVPIAEAAIASGGGGEATLAQFEEQLTQFELVRKQLILANHDYLSLDIALQNTDSVQTVLVKSCQDYALDLVMKFGTPDRAKVDDLESGEPVLQKYLRGNIQDEEAYIQNAVTWSRANPET
jgi:hypothetical protein